MSGGSSELIVTVSEFVALLNQTLEYAYPSVTITGELANFRISKNKWVYFDLKDELASVKFFGTIYQLPGPLEDGMLLKVRGVPRLHQLYGFSVNVQAISPVGEGSIRRAADLLRSKLEKEGLFDPARKRLLPETPVQIGLITSKESAAYADFIKIINARWSGLEVQLIDVQVQGEPASEQITAAIEHFNRLANPPEVLVITRGGGSAEDLQAFNTEQVTRTVAASRAPTLVAIGHEIDISLAELAADQRASTPSNAAEMLVPNRRDVVLSLQQAKQRLDQTVQAQIQLAKSELRQIRLGLNQSVEQLVKQERSKLVSQSQLLNLLSPEAALRRGYAIVRKNHKVVRSKKGIHAGDIVEVQLIDADIEASIKQIKDRRGK